MNQRLKNLKDMFKDPEPVDDNHWTNYLQPQDKTPVQEVKLPTVVDEEPTSHVDQLIPLALKVHHDILSAPLPHHEDEGYIPLAKIKLATAQSILSTQIKVDENQLKRRKQDDIMSILEELRDEEKKQAALEITLSPE